MTRRYGVYDLGRGGFWTLLVGLPEVCGFVLAFGWIDFLGLIQLLSS